MVGERHDSIGGLFVLAQNVAYKLGSVPVAPKRTVQASSVDVGYANTVRGSVMPIIRALASAPSKRAVLEFLNDWDRDVEIEGALAATDGEVGTMMQLLEAPLIVRPHIPVCVDVAAALGRLVGRDGVLNLSIQLVLNPVPPTQPQPALYGTRFLNGECLYFGPPIRSESF